MYHGDDRFDPTSEESDDTDDDSVLHDRNPLSDDGSNPSDVIEDNENNVEVPPATPQRPRSDRSRQLSAWMRSGDYEL